MGSVTTEFQGVCVHFKFGVAAGVPHRVVLPNAAKIMAGLLMVNGLEPPMTAPVAYYLLPHFPQIDVSSGVDLTIPNLMTDGDIHSGVRLQIANAIDAVMTYEGDVPSLTEFDPDYNFSSDVVVNGNALGYFDFFGGQFTPALTPGGAIVVRISVTTDGAPKLLVTPLMSTGGTPAGSFLLPLTLPGGSEDVTLTVKNLEPPPLFDLDVNQQNGSFDFLLNYLTARGGIPQTIAGTPPGMVPPLQNATPDDVGLVLQQIGTLMIQPTVTDPKKYVRRALVPRDQVTPSCSDSQYP